MSKYGPLRDHLSKRQFSRVPMTFDEIEKVIEGALPPSARKHRAWWSNNPSNSVITYAWLEAGFRTAEVSLEGERVVFVRQEAELPETSKAQRRNPVFGCMKSTVTFGPGTDVTLPADPDWADR